MAITIQAVEWKLSPFAVANKSYLVNDRLGYESQLIQAVVLQRAPIRGRFKVEFDGEGAKRRCTVSATLKGGEHKDGLIDHVSYTSPEIGRIPVQNSPLWKNDPDQQLFYYAGRALCRRHFPDVLLGIYTPEELYDAAEPRRGPEHARDVTPKAAPHGATTSFAPSNEGVKIIDTPSPNPPHDPNAGEIISDEMAQRAHEKTAWANAETDPPATNFSATWTKENDPTGEKAAAALAGMIAENAAKMAALDTQRLLADGHALAKQGARKFKYWHGRLDQKHADMLAPYLEELQAEANEAEAERAGFA